MSGSEKHSGLFLSTQATENIALTAHQACSGGEEAKHICKD